MPHTEAAATLFLRKPRELLWVTNGARFSYVRYSSSTQTQNPPEFASPKYARFLGFLTLATLAVQTQNPPEFASPKYACHHTAKTASNNSIIIIIIIIQVEMSLLQNERGI